MIQSFMKRNIDVSVRTGDIRQIDADVVALKYSQELIGAAQAVAQALGKTSSDMPALLPSLGSTHLFPGRGLIQARHALFLSVVPLRSFDYAEVRQFGFDALKSLVTAAPQTRHLAMTVQGAGFGLNPARALHSELQGCIEAIGAGLFPPGLERITFVDRNSQQVKDLEAALSKMLPGQSIETDAPDPPTGTRRALPEEHAPASDDGYDVFISYKSEDVEYARQVYEQLRQHGLTVFFSKESLPRLGSDEYHEQIDIAIERAHHLIVVTTSKEHVIAKWVKYEWRLFMGEKLAGRKSGNLMTVVAGDMSIDDLPIALRNREVIQLFRGELERLVDYVTSDEEGDHAEPQLAEDPGNRSPLPAEGAAPSSELVSVSDFVVCRSELLKNTSWNDAVDHSRNLSAGGCMDWTLPTLEQLTEIRKASLFPEDRCYWSSQTAPSDDAFYVHFDDGHIGRGPREFYNGLYAVFVREQPRFEACR